MEKAAATKHVVAFQSELAALKTNVALMNTVQTTHESSLACIMVSHFHWNQKQIGDLNSFAAVWSSPSPAGCLDRLFICPAWARKGYCDSKRKLMQKHCPSSCDFCYGKMQQQQQQQQRSGGKKKGESFLSIEQRKELLWTVCQRSNGSQQVQQSRAEVEVFKELIWREIPLDTGLFYFWSIAASPERLYGLRTFPQKRRLPVDWCLNKGCFM